ncbi:unnamed protein product [Discosporangium mesarthrocarpum]
MIRVVTLSRASHVVREVWARPATRLFSLGKPAFCSTETTATVHDGGVGVDVTLPSVLNTVTGELDRFPPPSSGPLTWYSCGPTVYDRAHLGHARTYICLDVVRRILTDYFRYDVVCAMGITDIDDKIIARGIEKGYTSWREMEVMARDEELQFLRDMDSMSVRRPDAIVRVTEHIPDIIAYIEGILRVRK